MTNGSSVEIVEVGPRDGFQSVGPLISTECKIRIIAALYGTGIRRMEATSFVSKTAVPQLADAVTVLETVRELPGLDAQVLVPTARQAWRALDAGAMHLAFVLSVSDRHNRSNVGRAPAESAEEYARILERVPAGTKIRLNLATAFDCPYLGPIPATETISLLETLISASPDVEVALCDTTGRVTPERVRKLFAAVAARFPNVRQWAFHAHDTFGMGAANTLAAWNAGVRVFDSSIAGLGGCPFAPGATGNVATEDLVYMFEGMEIATGIDLTRLTCVANEVATLEGAQFGGRVRTALAAADPRSPVPARGL